MFKSKRLWIMLAILMLLPFACKIKAETPSAVPYGQACLKVPTMNGQEYAFRWARLGTNYTVAEKVSGKIEMDFSKGASLIQAYGQRTVAKGLTLSFGKQLAPITALYPGSRGRQLTQPPHMFDGSTGFAVGILATFTYKGSTTRVMQFGNNQWSGAFSYHGLSVFWEEDVLSGALFESPWTTKLFHPSIGFGMKSPTNYTTVTVQNYWQCTKRARLYTQADIRDGQNSGLVGISYEQAPLCFVRIFREFSEHQHSTWAAELTFAF